MIEHTKELSSFVRNWWGKPRSQVVGEIASYSHETRRLPDPYSFYFDADGELCSPETGLPVKRSIGRDTPIKETEFQAFCEVADWAREAKSGAITLIFPPAEKVYPITKIIISEIYWEGEVKKVFNRAILLEKMRAEGCVQLAQNLALGKRQFTEVEEVRRHPIPLENQGIHWTYVLGEFIDEPIAWEMIRSGEDRRLKQETLVQAEGFYQDVFVKNGPVNVDSGFFGPYASSCPPQSSDRASASEILLKTALVLNGRKYFDCPNPKCPVGKIESGKGITTCPHCGARKEDYAVCV